MARSPRVDLGDYVYHVINRSNGKVKIFHSESDYKDFEYLLGEVKEAYNMRVLAYVIMSNHWHMLLYPKQDGDLSKALQWLSTSHAARHHQRTGTVGHGHLYQDRYKSFLVENDSHLLTVLKYIERNPVRAGLVSKAEEWRWGSAYRRQKGTIKEKILLDEGPTPLPPDYESWVNTPEDSEELDTIRHSVNKGVPYGQVLIPED